MCGTVTYPIAVRIARSKYLFKLRNFYAIHLAIAPFLALVHINIFGGVHQYMAIKIKEAEYRQFLEETPKHVISQNDEEYGKSYYKLKKLIL